MKATQAMDFLKRTHYIHLVDTVKNCEINEKIQYILI